MTASELIFRASMSGLLVWTIINLVIVFKVPPESTCWLCRWSVLLYVLFWVALILSVAFGFIWGCPIMYMTIPQIMGL